MSNKTYIIFFDHDGVFAQWDTWGNTTFFKKDGIKEIDDLDIYKLNRLDMLMQRISNDYNVYAVSTSSWKRVFYEEENIKIITERANLQKIKIKPVQIPEHFSKREPWTRIDVINEALKRFDPEDYIIIDDEFKYEYLDKGFHNIITTDKYDGLKYQDFLSIEQIVNKWNLDEEYKKYKEDYDKALDLLLSCAI